MPVAFPFAEMFAQAAIGLLITDRQGMICAVNDSCATLFGYKPDELTGKPINLIIPDHLGSRHTELLNDYFQHPYMGRSGHSPEINGRCKDGSELPVEVTLSYKEMEGELYAIAVITDRSPDLRNRQRMEELYQLMISRRTTVLEQTINRLAEQVRNTEAKDHTLHNLNTFLNGVLNHSGAMIFATRPDGILTLYNTAAQQNLGYSAEEIIGKHSPVLFHCRDEIRQKALRLSKKLNETIVPGFAVFIAEAKRGISAEQEWTYIRKDKSRFPVSLTTTALRNSRGEITGYIGVAIDISERKKMQTQLQAALDKERELNELKSRFVSVASHEFRTPLSTILSSVFLLQKYTQTEDQPRRDKHLNRIMASVNGLNAILNEFLSEGRIEEGKVTVTPRELEIESWVAENCHELEPLLKAGQHFEYSHEGTDLVHIDPVLFKHILVNLLTNAIKFSGENKPIIIHTRLYRGNLELTICDKGIGISRKDQQHLFERFFRGANAASIQGTGLGLHIVSRYTELMHGTIHYESELDTGTCFTLSFNTETLQYEKDTADRRQ